MTGYTIGFLWRLLDFSSLLEERPRLCTLSKYLAPTRAILFHLTSTNVSCTFLVCSLGFLAWRTFVVSETNTSQAGFLGQPRPALSRPSKGASQRGTQSNSTLFPDRFSVCEQEEVVPLNIYREAHYETEGVERTI